MCFGRRPQAPQIIYQGPSSQDVTASNEALEAFKESTAANTAAFQASINKQIADAQSSTDALLAQIKEMQGSNEGSNEGGNSIPSPGAFSFENIVNDAPYAITTEDNVSTEEVDAQTTKDISKRKKKPSTLRISMGGLSATPGSGINYGV